MSCTLRLGGGLLSVGEDSGVAARENRAGWSATAVGGWQGSSTNGLGSIAMNTTAWRSLPQICDSRADDAPFPYGFADDYLPPDVLAELESSFLDPGGHERLDVLGRGKMRVKFRAPPVPDFVSEAGPAWVEAVQTISSRGFLEPTWECVRGILAAEALPTGPYQDLVAEQLSLGVDDLLVQLEFSSLEAGTYLPPHTDATDKVLSCVLYLPQDSWRTEWGGVTEVYAALPEDPGEHARPNWSNRTGTLKKFRLVESVALVENRLFWFIKTANSWHGVSPVSAPPGIGRRSFNFSVAVRPEALERPRMAELVRDVLAYEAAPSRRSARSMRLRWRR